MKKFGKFLALTAAVGTACAAYCYFKQKNSVYIDDFDDDYDDFHEEEEPERNYVDLQPAASEETTEAETSEENSLEEITSEATTSEEAVSEEAEATDASDDFTPLSQQIPVAEEPIPDSTEEFFNDDETV